jgi:hypothetical protein
VNVRSRLLLSVCIGLRGAGSRSRSASIATRIATRRHDQPAHGGRCNCSPTAWLGTHWYWFDRGDWHHISPDRWSVTNLAARFVPDLDNHGNVPSTSRADVDGLTRMYRTRLAPLLMPTGPAVKPVRWPARHLVVVGPPSRIRDLGISPVDGGHGYPWHPVRGVVRRPRLVSACGDPWIGCWKRGGSQVDAQNSASPFEITTSTRAADVSCPEGPGAIMLKSPSNKQRSTHFVG